MNNVLDNANTDNNDNLSELKILLDEVDFKPVLDLERYCDTVVNLIKSSEPRFSIGVYGEWGSGKTTMMRIIERKLETDRQVVTVWFNAWRYEREDQFALIALMKTIAYAIGDLSDYQEVRRVLLRGLGIIGKDVLRRVALKYVMTDRGMEELEANLVPKMELLSEVDRETIYFDGVKKIEDEMKQIVQGKTRIVVFVDDLDRCSPKTALEVFESIKIFLSMAGFIYVMGLSHETISKLISASYKMYDSDVKGEHYIRKIIQIPIILPEWNPSDIQQLIDSICSNGKLNSKYSKIIKENKELISTAIEASPRELKRFINNFIVANEIYSINKEIKSHELLTVQTLKTRWKEFYRYFSSNNPAFREQVNAYLEMSFEERERYLNQTRNDQSKPPQSIEKKISEMMDYDLWDFLQKEKETIFNIVDWGIYRRAIESSSEISIPKAHEKLPDSGIGEVTAPGLSIRGLSYHNRGEYDKAIEYYDKAIDLDPEYVPAWYNKALTLIHKQDYGNAIFNCERALMKDRENPFAMSIKALALDRKGQFSDALKWSERAIKAANNAYIWNERGLLLHKLRSHNEAVYCYDSAINADPKNAYVFNNKGFALFEMGRYEEASKSFDEALQIRPGYGQALSNKALALERLGNTEDAFRKHTAAIGSDPNNAYVWNNFGLFRIGRQDYVGAIKCFDKAIELDEDYIEAWYNKAECLIELGNYEEALRVNNHTLAGDNRFDPIATNQKGKIFRKLGKEDEAEHYITEAKILGKQNQYNPNRISRSTSHMPFPTIMTS